MKDAQEEKKAQDAEHPSAPQADVRKVDRRFKDTEERILRAACTGIAERGTVGARVHRIARQAGTSTERVYSYFGNKNGLVQAVLDARLTSFESAAEFDPCDLESYLVRLFDFYTSHEDEVRFS